LPLGPGPNAPGPTGADPLHRTGYQRREVGLPGQRNTLIVGKAHKTLKLPSGGKVLLMLAQSSDTGRGGALVLLALYFAPTIVAAVRKHHNAVAIWALNLLLGWTVIGWIASLVWALTAVQRREVD
jgi:hypothetical protein